MADTSPPDPDLDPLEVWVDIMPRIYPNILDQSGFRVRLEDPRISDTEVRAEKNYSPWVWSEVDVIVVGGVNALLETVDATTLRLCCVVPTAFYRGDWMSAPSSTVDEFPACEWGPDGYEDLWLRVRKADLWNDCQHHLGTISDGAQFCFKICASRAGLPAARIEGRDAVILDVPTEGVELFEPIAALGPCYPNPFNPTTSFAITLARAGAYQVEVFNVTGQRVKVFGGYAAAGKTTIRWDGTNDHGERVASGTYFYRLCAGDVVKIRKMLLLK